MNNQGVLTPPERTASTFSWSSIGRKILMAVTGSAFIAFVTVHLVGNLQMFVGQDQINAYAQALHDLGPVVWFIRLPLALFFAIHIWTGIRLWLENLRARPTGYVRENTVQASLSSRTMIYSGFGLLVFVVYHLLHYTFQVTNPQYGSLIDAAGRIDVYTMVIMGFRNPIIAAAYIVAMFGLAYHLSHAVPSLFQTLGLSDHRWRPRLERIGNIMAVLAFIGYASIPVGVLTGIISLAEGGN